MGTFYFFHNEQGFPFTYLTPEMYVGPLPCPYESVSNPTMFLEFALQDKEIGDTRGLVNSFGNMKKALHLRIDMLLNQYGLFHHYRKKSFPTKLEVLDDIGILPTTIVRNLNIERNLLEHEYVVPSETRVQEAIDVTQLIYMASESFLIRTVTEAVVGFHDTTPHAVLRLEPNRGEIQIFELDLGKNVRLSDDGIEHISNMLRDFITGEINNGFKVSDKPFRTLVLNEANKPEWLSIVQFLVSISKKKFLNQVEEADITTTVTIAVSEYKSQALTEALAKLFSKKKDE